MGKVVDAIGEPFLLTSSQEALEPLIAEKSQPPSSALRTVKPVFVSVDPARDSVEQVRRYALGVYYLFHAQFHSYLYRSIRRLPPPPDCTDGVIRGGEIHV